MILVPIMAFAQCLFTDACIAMKLSKFWYELVYATIFHLCNRLDNLLYWGTQTSLDLFSDAINTEISCAGPYCAC